LDERRRQYLEAMGIPVWEARAGAARASGRQEPDPAAEGAVAPSPPVPDGPARESSPAAAAHAVPELPPHMLDEPPLPALEPHLAHWEGEPAGEPQAPAVPPVAALDWEALQARVAQCSACALHRTRTRTVFGVGDRNADWLIVGEAPGAEEDRQGEPFVGRAGQLLDAMLEAAGLHRSRVYIANILKCRPPNNRDPEAAEARSCRPYLDRQIALIRPRLIVAVGRVAAQNLLDSTTPIGALRGKLHRYRDIPMVVTYHPAYLLRSPAQKRRAWEDLQLALRVAAPSR
jgi:uracil-DNA glycosylase family 4